MCLECTLILTNHVDDISVTPYDPDSQFTMEALSRLVASGIPVLSFLNTDIKSLRHTLGLSEPAIHTLDNPGLVLNSWMRGFSKLNVLPTWKNLLLVIRKLNLDKVARQIESYLSGKGERKRSCSLLTLSVYVCGCRR